MKQQEQIINEFKKIKCNSDKNVSIPISYLIRNTKIERRIVFQIVDYLLEKQVIEKKIVSICPNCYESNIQNYDDAIVKCSYCNEIYSSNDKIEKYRLKD